MPPKAAPRRGAASASSSSRPQTENINPSAPNASRPTPTGRTTTGAVPTRAPVQRLQTLNKRTSTGSIAPAARTSATPGPSGAPGESAKPTLKYKPRAVGRRSKEEREAIEKLEAERHRERLKEAAAIQRGRGGSRGGPFGRGRGGGVGGAGVGGPLGAGTGGGGRRGRGGRFGGDGGRGDSRASSMGHRSRTRSVIDMGSAAASRDVSSDESDSGVLVDIDQINLDSDEEGFVADDEPKKGKGKMAMADADVDERGLRPIRVERHEHAERVVSVNMESSSSKSAELREQAQAKAKDDDALFVPQEDQVEEVRVKEEPTDDGDQVMKDVPTAAADDTAADADDEFLPAQKVKVRRNLSKEPTSKEATPAPAPAPAPTKDPKSLLRTKEDIEEYERHEQDLVAIKDLLITEPKLPKEKEPQAEEPTTVEGEGDKPETAAEEKEGEEEKPEEEEIDDKLSGQLFLMQFPPMTPNLVIPSATTDGDGEARTEPTTTTNPEPQPAEPTVKHEDTNDPELIIDTTTQAPKLVTANDQQLPAGRVGKLNVHASGKVTLDWGGISFELDKATDVDFLQEALILSTPPTHAGMTAEEIKTAEEEEKRVWAMGQLSGKFTVTPDWAKIL